MTGMPPKQNVVEFTFQPAHRMSGEAVLAGVTALLEGQAKRRETHGTAALWYAWGLPCGLDIEVIRYVSGITVIRLYRRGKASHALGKKLQRVFKAWWTM